LELFAKEMSKDFSALKKLELGFRQSLLTENGDALRKFIKEIFCVKFKELILDFENSQTNEETMKGLLSEIENNAKQIEIFHLDLTDCQGITSQFQNYWVERLKTKLRIT